MGEIAEMMLDGTLCEGCGDYLGSDNGYPTRCAACRRAEVPSVGKVKCPTCGKRVTPVGLADHVRVKHPVAEGR